MSKRSQKGQVVVILSLLALVCVLAYTFWHTGALLSRYIVPGLLGYVAAAGVELTVIGMSIQFRDIVASPGKSPGTKVLFVFVFLAALAVSALANVSEGFRVASGVPLMSTTFSVMDPLVAVIGVSATGLLSLVVMSLAELLGDSFNVVLGIANDLTQRERQAPIITVESVNTAVLTPPVAPPMLAAPPVDGLATARAQRQLNATEARAALVTFLAEHPKATQTEAGAAVGRSRSWVSAQLRGVDNG
jgi:hypothetical protein